MKIRTPRPIAAIEVNYDESRVEPFVLPPLLRCADGTVVGTAGDFLLHRRPEILDFYTREYYGKVPPRPERFAVETLTVKPDALDDTAVRKEIRLTFSCSGRAHSWIMLVYMPQGRGRFPVFCGLNFKGNHATTDEADVIPTGKGLDGVVQFPDARGEKRERWQFAEAVRRGYAVATACYHDVFPDLTNAPGSWEKSVYGALFPGRGEAELHREYSAIGAWAWGLSRMLDALECDPAVDVGRAAVIGHSRLGKTALWAGATDERFGLVISNCSGHGGAALIRRFFGETNELLRARFPHWFVSGFVGYLDTGTDFRAGFDQHFLLSLIAPRRLCVGSATEDLWADPKGEFLAAAAASEAYRLFGSPGLEITEMPPPDAPVSGDISYHLRTGAHDITRADWEVYWNAADRLQSEKSR